MSDDVDRTALYLSISSEESTIHASPQVGQRADPSHSHRYIGTVAVQLGHPGTSQCVEYPVESCWVTSEVIGVALGNSDDEALSCPCQQNAVPVERRGALGLLSDTLPTGTAKLAIVPPVSAFRWCQV